MLKSYLKTALRNLARNKIYSGINIAGLSIGLACAMLIMLYVKDEVSFDKFHADVDQIYRVVQKRSYAGDSSVDLEPYTGYFEGPRFAGSVPEIKAFVRYQADRRTIKKGTEVVSQEVYYTDSSFFDVFSFPLLKGSPRTALKNPEGIVISEDFAKGTFGTIDVMGKTVQMKDGEDFREYIVTGVSSRQPENSSIKFEVLMPMKVDKEVEADGMNWFNSFMNTFVVLHPGADLAKVEAKMHQFYLADSKAAYEAAHEKYGMTETKMYLLQPFTAMHLSTDLEADNGLVGKSNPVYSYILTGIAIFILLIACINFVNLTVARSVKRAKEIGIRKVIGGERKQLIVQFLGESFLLSFAAFILAIFLVQAFLPMFNDLANKKLVLSYLADIKLVSGYIFLFLVTAFLAGFYPALVLSGYSPVDTLYSRFVIAGKNYLQKSLVVLQFSLASFLIIGTMVIYSQLEYLSDTDLGYDDSNLVIVGKSGMTLSDANIFRDELLKSPYITRVAVKNLGSRGTVAKVNGETEQNFRYETVDETYLDLLKVPVVKGRGFSTEFPADSVNSVLVNEAFVAAAGWKQPIGEIVDFWYNKEKFSVVGVVKNYHFDPLNQKISPQLFRMSPGTDYGKLLIRVQPTKETEALAHIQNVYKTLYPFNPYSYTFQDDLNRKNYDSEQKWRQIILFSAILTVFISCIGLFGLAVLAAEKRTKEIGVRKVLGASVNQLVTILSTDFLKLVIIALLIAVPASWIASEQWLQNYPYRFTPGWQTFLPACLLVLIVAFLTVSSQAFRAAISNPVKSLRSE